MGLTQSSLLLRLIQRTGFQFLWTGYSSCRRPHLCALPCWGGRRSTARLRGSRLNRGWLHAWCSNRSFYCHCPPALPLVLILVIITQKRTRLLLSLRTTIISNRPPKKRHFVRPRLALLGSPRAHTHTHTIDCPNLKEAFSPLYILAAWPLVLLNTPSARAVLTHPLGNP